jgi:predicted nucleic acid-binding protein
MGIQGLEILDAEVLERALEIYQGTTTDFSDAYIAASAESIQADAIATFNRNHFKNLHIKLFELE